jgi:spectinomycin phosphotransferase
LPLGADANTAVYRARNGETDYFVKLRSGTFDAQTVLVPHLLSQQGIEHVIAPLANRAEALWTALNAFTLILYPFIEGKNGFEQSLSAQNWIRLGQIMRQIHTVDLPDEAAESIRREDYAPGWRQQARKHLRLIETETFTDPIALDFAAFVQHQRAAIDHLIDHAGVLADVVSARHRPSVLCHGDIHLGNVLVTPTEYPYVVDWDTLVLAPAERDLMFMGAGIGGSGQHSPDEQAAFFYQGYGDYPVDQAALAYYRCERIVQDVCAYCEQILLTSGDSADRHEGLNQFQSQFVPGNVVERALHHAQRVRSSL